MGFASSIELHKLFPRVALALPDACACMHSCCQRESSFGAKRGSSFAAAPSDVRASMCGAAGGSIGRALARLSSAAASTETSRCCFSVAQLACSRVGPLTEMAVH